MSTPKFKKARQWLGKDLTLHVGGGDRRILDKDILEGPQWARFVGMGFLQEVKEPAAAAQPKPAAPPAPPAAPPASTSEGTTTKSHAAKLSAQGKGKGKGKSAEESATKPAEESATKTDEDPKTESTGQTDPEAPGPGASSDAGAGDKE
ncbi:MAG: hypothetical protein LC118_18550 [Dehalococcoidia bacterium]|nr:hypothetical protein [Dehalococcoidia bacterium]